MALPGRNGRARVAQRPLRPAPGRAGGCLRPPAHAYGGATGRAQARRGAADGQAEPRGTRRTRARKEARTRAAAAADAQNQPNPESAPETRRREARVLVEASLFASMTALVFHLSSLLRMESTFGATFPLPMVLAGVRHGRRGCLLTFCIASVLLVVLAGPIRTASFILMHGTVGVATGLACAADLPWTPAVLLTAVARTAGAIGTVLLSSAVVGENMFVLVASQAYGIVDACLGAVGAAASPSLSAIAIGTTVLIFTNCIIYCFLLYLLFSLVVRQVQCGGVTANLRPTLRPPKRVQKLFPDPNQAPRRL